ncbi:MAG: methyltransferase domain-containing protein [Flavobacteriales bacterium]|nr:methyltransferase domain-containing protein [Flavobacteriales bacterium]
MDQVPFPAREGPAPGGRRAVRPAARPCRARGGHAGPGLRQRPLDALPGPSFRPCGRPGPQRRHHKAAEVHADLAHVRWAQGRGEDLPYAGAAFDVVLCIGVLHHVPDPLRVLREIVRVLRPGGLLYFYMYYAMEQRSAAYRALHAASSWLRRLVHPLPAALRLPVCDLLAVIIYLPLVLTTRLLKRMGVPFWRRMPLAYYHDKSFRVMRNDALDRFGTPFEARSTQDEIVRLLADAGFTDVRFSDGPPYWHGTAKRPME